MDLFRLANTRRLVRPHGHLAHFNGGGGATCKTIRPIYRARRGVTKFLVFLFRMLLRDLQGEHVAHLIYLSGLKDNLISCGSVIIFMCGDRSIQLRIRAAVCLGRLS